MIVICWLTLKSFAREKKYMFHVDKYKIFYKVQNYRGPTAIDIYNIIKY